MKADVLKLPFRITMWIPKVGSAGPRPLGMGMLPLPTAKHPSLHVNQGRVQPVRLTVFQI